MFQRALPVLEHIEKHGFEAYFVGGSVRDAILGKPVNDIDIATSATPNEIKSIFKRTVDIGIEHGTVLVLTDSGEYEITTFRTESTYQDYRRPDEVHFVRSLKEDLKRRDFTINALALSRTGDLIDYYNGINDLKNGIIRAVGCAYERFNEDALRMMRAVRFASQLDFEIEKATFDAICEMHSLLKHIAVERMAVEFEKMLLGKNFWRGMNAMIESDLYRYCPGLKDSKHALRKFKNLSTPFLTVESAWVLLLYFLQTSREGDQPFTQPMLFLRKWKLSNKKINTILNLAEALIKRLSGEDISNSYIFDYGLESALLVEDLLEKLGYPSEASQAQLIDKKLSIHTKSELDVTGRDLMQMMGEKGGPWVGQWLDHALSAVVSGRIPNEKESILDYLTKEFHDINGGGE